MSDIYAYQEISLFFILLLCDSRRIEEKS